MGRGQFYSVDVPTSGTASADGDIVQLRVPSSGIEAIIYEIIVGQILTTVIREDVILFRRGTGGTGGTTQTEREYNTGGTAALVEVFEHSFTADITGITWQASQGWLTNQALIFRPVPRLRPRLRPGDHFSVANANSVTQLGMNIFIAWEEIAS